MKDNTYFSIVVPVFHGRTLPEKGAIVGYAAIIEALALAAPIPAVLALISDKNNKYETEDWRVFTPRYKPEETLYKQLVFALKYEGLNLLVFKKLFKKLSREEVIALLKIEPTGQYSRKIWFLFEWLMEEKLDIPDLKIKQAIPLIDPKLQYAIKGLSSPRHRIINNLPGTRDFCPLIRKTDTLEKYISEDIASQKQSYLNGLNKEYLQRASAFLLLKDSKASFTIEGESTKDKRAMRWGQTIGQAGIHELTKEELLRLQSLAIEDTRFTKMGFRTQGGFVGEHDRSTGEPIPDHISAKWEETEQLIEGLLSTNKLLMNEAYNAVLIAATIAFGFVFIHPFVDGNGRIHRYLIHHILARNNFSQQGIIFPVSASILDHIGDYRKVLEKHSHPLLKFIEWEEANNHNIKVLNDTIDYYRYFDVTSQAEFLFECIKDTFKNIIPEEIEYLKNYDNFKKNIDNLLEMPDNTISMLVRFLAQNDGKLSKRALARDFKELTEKEVLIIENTFYEIFLAP
jgi:Fic family protein